MLDGGSLLHRLPWHNDSTFRDIARYYASFVTANYGQATVVFDGYTSEYTIKDMTHNHRTNTIFPSVNFTPDMIFTGSKEMFLTNKGNKQKIITLIAEEIQQGCSVIHAVDDADIDIVKTAVESSKIKNTTVIGEDTDLLVLLIYWCKSSISFETCC